jgi:hypothetical protein
MSASTDGSSILVMVTRDGMGHADPELRHKLIATYFNLLVDSDLRPGAIAFYADGVKLAVEGSPVIDSLRALEAKGTHLILCQTCLNHLGLADKVAVGIVGGMTDIIAAQWKAGKVITL